MSRSYEGNHQLYIVYDRRRYSGAAYRFADVCRRADMRFPCGTQQQIQFLGGVSLYGVALPDVLEQEPVCQHIAAADFIVHKWLLSLLGNRWFAGIFPSDPIPYLDACVTVLILVAQFLSALKKWDCWVAWLLVNVTQMCLHISVGHVFMPIVSGLYLINGIVSLYNWSKLYKNKA